MNSSREVPINPRARAHGVFIAVIALFAATLIGLTTSPAQAAVNYPSLKTGSSGSNVTSLQYLLGAGGFSTPPDGQFGSGTKAAVTAFQKSEGLVTDGVAGPKTFTKLVPVLKEGADGQAVQALQVQLKKHGHNLLTDGDFGPLTTKSVKAFQKKKGLTVDGVVGPVTWRYLLGSGGSSTPPGTTYDSLSDEQLDNAKTILGVAKGADVPERGMLVAIATVMQESKMINIDYGDRDSIGLFQQRTSQGWGTLAEIGDPVKSSKAFFGVASHTNNPGLLDISGWEDMSITRAADAVQRSCCPDAYAQWVPLAQDVVAHLKDSSPVID
ncbi:MAG: peptidoglycan-binding protein [Nocardioides sp.]|nr:peptidoglycan-binding protein [Nocardioides sp.]